MRLRILLPCALAGVVPLTSCSNSPNLASPNKQPVYRAKVVEVPPVQVAEAGTHTTSQPQLAGNLGGVSKPAEGVSNQGQAPVEIARVGNVGGAEKPVTDPSPSLSASDSSRVSTSPTGSSSQVVAAQSPASQNAPRVVSPTAPAPQVIAASAAPRPSVPQVQTPVRQAPAPSSRPVSGGVVRTTAYTHTEADSLQYGKKNAAGGILKYGNVRSAAADWSVYPVGTIFKMEGDPNIYEIDDYGRALVGSKTIDIYKPNKQAMNEWGVRHVPIKVLRWGSFSKSLEILKPRVGKAEHVRQMVKSIQAKGA